MVTVECGIQSHRHGLRAGESLTKKGSVSARGERAVGMVPGRQTLLLLSCRSYFIFLLVARLHAKTRMNVNSTHYETLAKATTVPVPLA